MSGAINIPVEKFDELDFWICESRRGSSNGCLLPVGLLDFFRPSGFWSDFSMLEF